MSKFGEIGSSGLAEFSGTIQEDFLRELRGQQAYKRFNEMRMNSPVIGGLLTAIENAIRGVEWRFESEEGEDDERIEFLDAALKNMSHDWNDHISEALTFLPFGWSLFEIVYRYGKDAEHPDDPDILAGKMTWRKLAIRGQDTLVRWVMDENGGLLGFTQQAAPKYGLVTIPIEKLVLYRTRVEKNNPEGRSILRTSWIPYYFQKHIQQIEAIGVERDLAGLPVITLPESAKIGDAATDDNKVAEKLVRNIRNDEQAGLVLPNGWEMELMSTGGSRQFDTDKIINRHESRMLMSCLAQVLLLGQEGVGSLALSRDQSDMLTMSINSISDILGATFAKFPTKRLLALNGYPTGGIKLTHSPAGDVDIAALTEMLSKLGQYLTWTTQDEIWLRSTAKLPEVDEDTLEEAKAEKQEQALSLITARGTRSEDEPRDRGNNDDDLEAIQTGAVDTFAVEPLDADERRKSERMMLRSLKRVLAKQREHVVRGAKRIGKTS